MSTTLIFAIGVGLFALTTWATLVIGYMRFQHINEPESPDETVEAVHDTHETDETVTAPGPTVDGYDQPSLRLVSGE
ncbi:MAG: hypothetical protein RIE08_11990 [Acidimicrobiales bacterium]